MRVIETTYAGTGGVLIGTGARWLLLAAEPPTVDVEALWSLLTGPGPAADAVVDLLEKQHPLGLPSLALLDLSSDGVDTVTRGSGRVTLDGDDRLLTLGVADGRPGRRLVGGVVTAGSARVREVVALPPAPVRPRSHALIDAVPEHILAATAPQRGHDPRRWARALNSSPRSAVTDDPLGGGAAPAYAHDPAAPPAFEPAQPPHPDPDHDGQTSHRPATGQAAAGADAVEDEDGRTARSPAPHLRHPTSETVLAVQCPAGHLTAAYTPECRVCRRPVTDQDPQRVPRPRLGALTLPTGEVVPLDRGVALGRKPRAVPGGEPYPHLVHLPAESTYLSRMHLQIELDGWLVLARDLGSRGGTRLHVPGREPEQLRPHEAYVLEHGHTLDLADVYPVTFEVVQ